MVNITKYLAKNFNLPVSPWDHEFEQKSAGDFWKSFQLSDRNTLPSCFSDLLLPTGSSGVSASAVASVRTSGYPGGAWVLIMTLSPCHPWTAYCRPPSSREKQTLCLFRPLCSGSLGSPWPACLLSALVYYREAHW